MSLRLKGDNTMDYDSIFEAVCEALDQSWYVVIERLDFDQLMKEYGADIQSEEYDDWSYETAQDL